MFELLAPLLACTVHLMRAVGKLGDVQISAQGSQITVLQKKKKKERKKLGKEKQKTQQVTDDATE